MRSFGRKAVRVAGILLPLMVAAVAVSQTLPGPVAPPPGAAVAAAPAVPDTATGLLELAPGAPVPVRWFVRPDTVRFGSRIEVFLEFAPDGGPLPDLAVAPGQDWLVPVVREEGGWLARFFRQPGAAESRSEGLPEALGPRFLAEFQVYRLDPFVLELGFLRSPVIHVMGRAEGARQTAVIRDPRSLGWPFWTLLALVLAALAAAVGMSLLIRRRAPGIDWVDSPCRAPAWLAATLETEELLRDDLLAQGDSRAFLDRLAGIARRYAAGHFAIPAQEMTGGEISAACKRLGHPAERFRSLARLIDEADRRRYDPEHPSREWSLARAGEFFTIMDSTRVLPRHVAVPAATRVAADQAWTRLERELGSAGRTA